MNNLSKFLKVCIWSYAVIYLLSCLTPYISPIHFPPFTFLALLFPCMLIGMLLNLLLGLFILKKKSFFLLLILLLGYKNIFSTTGFHKPKKFTQQKQTGTIRLLSWNVNDFVDCQKRCDTANSPRRNIMKFISSANADILCLQDFSSNENNESMLSTLKYLQDSLKYQFYYFSVDDPCKREYNSRRYGAIILSKFPITDSGRFAYNKKHLPEHLMYATVNINGKVLRLYNTHLRSMFLHWHGGYPDNNPFLIDDAEAISESSTAKKLKYFDSLHTMQAILIKQQLNNCKLPYVFCADLNSVPSSYVYQQISSGLNDAFLQNGAGWGGTYSVISPTLRIDVVLLSKQLNSTQYYSPHTQNASDHYPVVTDIKIN